MGMMGWECPTKSMLRETSAGKVINSSWLRNHLDEEVQELCKNLVAKWKEACGFDIKDKAVKATAEKPTEIQKEKEKGKGMRSCRLVGAKRVEKRKLMDKRGWVVGRSPRLFLRSRDGADSTVPGLPKEKTRKKKKDF